MNKHRGEVEITLEIDGESRTLAMRPTFDFIAEVEASQGSLFQIMQGFLVSQWKIMDMIAIVQSALKHDKSVTKNQIRDAILDAGAVTFVKPVTDLLVNAVTGGREPEEGNAGPATN